MEAPVQHTVPVEHRGKAVIFYDGVCGMCNRLVKSTMASDRRGRLLYAPLQGKKADTLLAPHGIDPARLDTVVLLSDYGLASERVWTRSYAAFEIARILGGIYRPLSWLRILPRFITDAAYRWVAAHRYQIFGKFDACAIPTPEERARFIDRP